MQVNLLGLSSCPMCPAIRMSHVFVGLDTVDNPVHA
jgi:hypothetical protein